MPGTQYFKGDLVLPSVFKTPPDRWVVGNYTGFMFRAQNDGTTGTTQPVWPAFVGTSPPIDNEVVWKAEPEPLCGFVDVENGTADGLPDPGPLPLQDRGFDDPQADPDLTFISTGKVVTLHYKRADIYAGLDNPLPPSPEIFPYQQKANDADNGNPPWGSQPGVVDNDADGLQDPIPVLDRHNRGEYAGFYNTREQWQYAQQFPNDAFADSSHPLSRCAGGTNVGQPCSLDSQCPLSTCIPSGNPCDPYTQDCGGIAHFPPEDCTGVGFVDKWQAPCLKDAAGQPYHPYPSLIPTPPPLPETWPLVPFRRDWVSTDGDAVTAIKRLLRFASSIVSFDQTQSHMFEYQLAEDSNAVIVTGVGTPLAGSLKDAYDYFYKSVFHQNDASKQDDPYVNCRVYKVVLITDGLSSLGDPCIGGPTSKGPAGDLGALPLPENPVGARALANAIDNTIPVVGVPVVVVAMGLQSVNGTFDPRLQCIADNSGGRLIPANNRQDLVDALKSILDYKRAANFFASPALPAFASASGDEAVIGSVIPSHFYPPTTQNPAGTAASWAVWNGSLKAYRLDANGNIPTIAVTPPATLPPGTPTPTPTPGMQALAQGFPDESDPDDSDSTMRRPVWNASRVLGYTNPATTLTGAEAAANPVGAVSVWPGRKMVWADNGAPAVPLPRQDFSVPDTNNPPGTCGAGANCFVDLVKAMGLNPALASDVTKTTRAVQFLRGGKTTAGSRDEVLTDLGTYGSVTPGSRYSYVYQDDTPAGNTSLADTAAYPHKLGDIFHSEPTMLLPPKSFTLLSSDVTPRTGACGTLPDCSYATFALFHQYRRKAVLVGSNDGFFHAFDAGVWDRDTDNSPQAFDLGTGQELFAYAPKALMNLKFPSLLKFPPEVQYFVDGTPALGDVFIGPTASDGSADPSGRTWKTVAVSGLRQGGHAYFALDVTQPDQVKTDVPTTDILYGSKIADKASSPDCLDGGGTCAAAYPTVLWEITDDCVINGTTCVTNMGETWSRPVVGRIQVLNGSGTEDRYVALFGGGFDSAFTPGTQVLSGNTTSGRAIYIVDVERGQVIYKATQGKDDGDTDVRFAPMPAPPAVGDVNDDGYLDVAYFGDMNGRMWRLDLTPDSGSVPKRGVCAACGTSAEAITGYQPFLLYDAMTQADLTTLASQPIQPIFLEPSIIFISGGQTPVLGVAFGTGYRAELMQPNLRSNPAPNGVPSQIPYANRFHFVIDSGGTTTLRETDLVNITPSGGVTAAGTGPAATNTGYFLDFASLDEKAVSTVFSTRGNLTLVTFTPSLGDPCSNTGSSFRYRFFFLTGQGGVSLNAMGTPGTVEDYREFLSRGLAEPTQSQSPSGVMIDTVLFPNGALDQKNTSFLKTNAENWKEQ